MNLIHYTKEKFSLEPGEYPQSELSWNAKPNGLWVSVEGPYDWKWWCESVGFNLYDLAVSYEITLKENAKILFLDTEAEIFGMAKKYPYEIENFNSYLDTYQLNWNEIKKEYQGIIIPQYFWACRMSLYSCWYYGWDCASGCIWDLSCIEEFKLKENMENIK
jgi:hypothetical protein